MISIKKQQIITAATEVFAKRGYQSTKIDEVAKKAGVAKGSVYLYFDSKEQLFEEVMKEGVRNYKQVKLEALNTDLPFYEKLKLMLIKETDFLWENQEVARFLLTSDIVTQKTLAKWLIEIRQTFMQRLQQEFDQAISEGVVKPGDSLMYTRVFRGVEHQVIAYHIIIDGKKPTETMIEQSLEVLTHGIFVQQI